MRRRGEQITALAFERLRQMGIPVEVTVMRGNPEFLISFAARKWPADLILIRAHNRNDFRNWLLGSVAKSVVKGAPCSVEVIRDADEPHSVSDNWGMRILLATDGSDVTYSLVFPTEANFSEGKISILAPIGTAILGYKRGDTIEWPVPSGVRRLKVDEVLYQPEAAGDYQL